MKSGKGGSGQVDYSRRDRSVEKNMFKENTQHLVWKDRLRKEREGFNK